MRLIEITEQNNQQYQAFVQSKGVFLQDFAWGNFHAGFKKTYRFAVESDSGEILAALQMFEHRISKSGYFYAPYGPVLKGPDREVLGFLLAEIKKRFPKILFLRIEPQQSIDFKNLGLRRSISLNPHKTLVLDLNKTEQQLLAEMHQKTRYNIKVAERNGVAVKIFEPGDPAAGAKNLFQPILDAGARAHIRSFPESYYKNLAESFSKPGELIQAGIFTAWHDNDLLATNLMIFYRETATYLFGGSANIKRNLMAPYLLHWHAIKLARQRGYKKYDFWGVEDDPNHPWAGISRFKFGFGGELKVYGGTMDFVIRPAWYNAYRFFRALNRLVR